ncbi:MAG: 16S rRNA (guanine(527)-N(7))-methyltransferase RsmG [Bacillota bacterium]
MKWQEFNDSLKKGLKEMKVESNDSKNKKLYQYTQFLIKENKKYNLTTVTNIEEIIQKHLLDSLSIFKIKHLQFDNFIDVGSGAGLPGLILKIYRPKLKSVLIDSTLKKVRFMIKTADKLSLNDNLEILHERAEKLAHQNGYREKYDLATARAVAPLKILIEYTIPFVKKNGLVILYKGPDWKNEKKESLNALKKLRTEVNFVSDVNIPGLQGERYLVVLKKNESTPENFPRRPGIPKKRPL